MATINQLHPQLTVQSVLPHNGGATFECTFQGRSLEIFKPEIDVISTPNDEVEALALGVVDTVFRPREEGPCGGVNMAELVLDKLIIFRDSPDSPSFRIYGNHPPSKGAERSQHYRDADVDFETPIDLIAPRNVLLFSAHGADPRELQKAKDRGLFVVDTTCPLVDKIYSHIRKAKDSKHDGQEVTLPGETAVMYLAPLYKADHPEVTGTRGVVESAGFRFVPVRTIEEALSPFRGETEVGPEKISFDGVKRILVTGLTTNNAKEVLSIGAEVEEAANGEYEVLPYNERDVCRTVQYRQNVVEELVAAGLLDEVIVLGAVESNNTNELVRKVLDEVFAVEDKRLRRIVFANHFSQLAPDISGDVLLSSGASTAQRNIEQAMTFLNPSSTVLVGQKEKLSLFRPLGRGSLAERILADDFDWIK